MARSAVEGGRTNILHACRTFGVSETCFRYQAKASEEDARIADWLVRLTTAYRDWGFGLCFLHLRNVKGFGWNHKRVYRIYRELELSLRIKPKKRLYVRSPSRWPCRKRSTRPGRWISCTTSSLTVATSGCSTY